MAPVIDNTTAFAWHSLAEGAVLADDICSVISLFKVIYPQEKYSIPENPIKHNKHASKRNSKRVYKSFCQAVPALTSLNTLFGERGIMRTMTNNGLFHGAAKQNIIAQETYPTDNNFVQKQAYLKQNDYSFSE